MARYPGHPRRSVLVPGGVSDIYYNHSVLSLSPSARCGWYVSRRAQRQPHLVVRPPGIPTDLDRDALVLADLGQDVYRCRLRGARPGNYLSGPVGETPRHGKRSVFGLRALQKVAQCPLSFGHVSWYLAIFFHRTPDGLSIIVLDPPGRSPQDVSTLASNQTATVRNRSENFPS